MTTSFRTRVSSGYPFVPGVEEYHIDMLLGRAKIGEATIQCEGVVGAITSIMIVGSQRRRGYGSQLWRYAEGWLKLRGIKTIETQPITEEGYRLAISEGYTIHPTYVREYEAFLMENPHMEVWKACPLLIKALR